MLSLRRSPVGWLFVLLLAPICCTWHAAQKPDIILIVIDTLRADRLGCYGSSQGLTPFLDELGRRGTVFRHAYAASSWTCPSVASLFTSRYPAQHHVASFESRLADEEVTLAEKLNSAGYGTIGYSANPRLLARLGYAQGFDTWRAQESLTTKLGGQVLARWVQGWLGRRGSAPSLLYLQYMEPHAPYQPEEPFRSRLLKGTGGAEQQAQASQKLAQNKMSELSPDDIALLASLYDGEVAMVDDHIRRLFDKLGTAGLLQHAVVVIAADHGEEFRDHGGMGHGTALYNETVRVPLIILAPGFEGGRTVEENVSLVDVAPTLLELAGLPPEPRFEGRSLVPLLRSESFASRLRATLFDRKKDAASTDVIVQLEATDAQYDLRRHTEGILRQSMKLLVQPGGKTEGYDLSRDPGENEPNDAAASAEFSALHSALQESGKRLMQRSTVEAEKEFLDEGTKDKLRRLGYTF